VPIIVLAILGVIGIVAGILASRVGTDRRTAAPAGRFARHFRISKWIGVGLALASWPLTGLMSYPYDDGPGRPGRIAGVPFIAAYFDQHGADFVGPFTIPAVLGNSVFWFYFPRLMVVAVALARERLRLASARGS
jgi:hypothetical protein